MTLEKALGFLPKIETKQGASLQKARLDEQSLGKVIAHWRSLAMADRPSLRSLSHSPGEGKNPILNMVFDLGGPEAWLCLELPITERAFPDFSSVWPYCRWWQEELTTFSGLKFEGDKETAGVSWRLA